VTLRRSLLRQEAIEFQHHHRQWGQVVLLQPLPVKIMAWSITAAAGLVIVFLLLAQYARKETVIGYLTPMSGTVKIFAPQQGTIDTIYVEQGQRIEEAQPLMSVTTNQIAANGQDVNATMLNTLTVHKDSLAWQIAADEQRVASERERLTAVIGGLETELVHLRAQIALQNERIQISEELRANAVQLAPKGYVSELEKRRRQAELLEQKQNFTALSQQLAARQNQLTETRYSLEQLPTLMAEKIQLLRNELTATEQRIAEINGRRAYIIRAPIAGRISTLQASVGQTANPQRLQLQIVPASSALQAELFVPTRAIGFVRVGQEVRILYDAFPYQHFGTYRGRIIKVSQTILIGSDISTPVEIKEPSYKVTVALDQPDIDAYGESIPLQPDMLLRADIILERRSLLNWLLNPLLGTRMQG
jgi:membrane fusion protein